MSNIGMAVLGVLIGASVSWLWSKLRVKPGTAGASLEDAPVLVCDVRVFKGNEPPLEVTNVTDIRCGERDCILRIKGGGGYCIREWDMVETTPFEPYIDMRELAAVLVGEGLVPPPTPVVVYPELEDMLDHPGIRPPVIPPEDPLAKTLMGLEEESELLLAKAKGHD